MFLYIYQNYTLTFSNIPPGKCAWIGAGRLHGKFSPLQWIRLPSNRTHDDPFTSDGPYLNETYNNFAGGDGYIQIVQHLHLVHNTSIYSLKNLEDVSPFMGN